ncbi:MAG TPA: glycosyltransferase family 1 protein [Candidatus Nanoarchaeia archaeon]|nr:glycosyltransferase family 1 protein [Candidatus Nanoarchaeia archaeon]
MIIGIDIRTLMDKEYSGVSWYTQGLLTEILRQDKINEYRLFYNSGRDISSRISNIGIRKSDNVKIVATRCPNKFFNYFLQKICRWPKLDRIGGEVDLFWSPHFNFTSLSVGVKNILTIHDLSFIVHPDFFSARQNSWHKFLGIKKLIERADIIIAISENTKADLIRYFGAAGDKIKVIYSGVGGEFRPLENNQAELNSVKEKYSLPERFILNVGAFEPRKNLSGLISAFDSIADQPGMGEWQLVLAGSKGWKNKEIFQTIAQAKNKSRIKAIGYVEKNERVALYNSAKIFAYPSFYEGFGLPVLEAMACGTPVIASDVSSLPEVAGDAALLVDPHDENSIGQALQLLMRDDKLRQLYSARGLNRAKNFSWQKSAGKYLKILNSEF